MNRTSKMVINMEINALTHEHLPRSQNMGLGGGASIYIYIYVSILVIFIILYLFLNFVSTCQTR